MVQLTARIGRAGSRGRTALRSWGSHHAGSRPERLDVEHPHVPVQPVALDPDRLLMPLDFVSDRHSLAGLPLTDSPHLDFARRVLAEPDLDQTSTELHRVAGHLAGRSASARAWGPDQDCAELTYQVWRVQQGHDDACHEPVVLAEVRDGRHMVVSGVGVLAAAVALGRTSWDVQITPENEVRAAVRERLGRLHPHAAFRRNVTLAGMLGSPAGRLDPEAVSLAQEIAAAPLVDRGDLYQPLPFPEFSTLKSQADDSATYQRLQMVLDVSPEPQGMRYLDLGCNVGFYDFSMARRGAVVAGLDVDERFISIARRTAEIKGVDAEFIAAPLEPTTFACDGALGGSRPTWDLVTCFSVLQWVMKDRDEDFGIEVLQAVREHSDALLFDIPVNCGSPRLSAAPGWELSRTEELLRTAGYTQLRHVGTVAPYGSDRRHVFYCR